MKSLILNIEEENLNFIVLILGIIADIASFIVVVGFLDGDYRDYIVLFILPFGILLRVLEKKVRWFKIHAKYIYMLCPCFATVTAVISNDGKYSAITQFYFMWLIMAVAYCDKNMVLFCSSATIATNIGALIFFPEPMLKIDNLTIWGYIFIIYLMETILAMIIANRMRNLIEQAAQIKMYEDELVYYEQLEKKDEKYSEVIHDLSHYFQAIGELAREGYCAPILKLTEELNLNLAQNERIIYINHKVVNAILSEKGREAFEKNINFDVYIEPGIEFGKTMDCDLVAIIGNLMDNALEAAGHCTGEKRKVALRMFMEKDGRVCVIKVINFFVQKPHIHKSGFLTSKTEKGLHGIGLRSVKNTAEKYSGYLQCLVDEECFTAILILPVQKNDAAPN